MEPEKETETVAPSEQNLSPRPSTKPSMTNRQPKMKRKKTDLEELKKEVVMVRMPKANCP